MVISPGSSETESYSCPNPYIILPNHITTYSNRRWGLRSARPTLTLTFVFDRSSLIKYQVTFVGFDAVADRVAIVLPRTVCVCSAGVPPACLALAQRPPRRQLAVDPPLALSALRGSLRAAFQQVHGTLGRTGNNTEALRRLILGIADLQFEREHPAAASPSVITDQFVLFFDGGSRGNTGPGGAGAVLVRVDAWGGHPRIEWVAAMSLANAHTTNNQAENFGLATGLRHANSLHCRPLTVVGDSALIVTQLRDHRPPKDPQLKLLYGQARVQADVLGITAWCHHVRAYNKMADSADTRRSTLTMRPLSDPAWTTLATNLRGDVEQWQASTYPGLTGPG